MNPETEEKIYFYTEDLPDWIRWKTDLKASPDRDKEG